MRTSFLKLFVQLSEHTCVYMFDLRSYLCAFHKVSSPLYSAERRKDGAEYGLQGVEHTQLRFKPAVKDGVGSRTIPAWLVQFSSHSSFIITKSL